MSDWGTDEEEDWDDVGGWDKLTFKVFETEDQRNCKEIDCLQSFYYKKEDEDNSLLVLLYFPISLLLDSGLNTETLTAWGLTPTQCFGVRFQYLNNILDETKVEAGQIEYDNLDNPINKIMIHKTVISWVVTNLAKTLLRREQIIERKYKVDDLKDIFDTFQLTPDVIIPLLSNDSKTVVEERLCQKNIETGTEEQSINMLAKYNLYVKILKEMKERISQSSTLCLICSSKVKNSGIKPIICSTTLCQVKYYDFGIGYSLEAEISMNPETLELQVTLAHAAFTSNSKTLEFLTLREGMTNEKVSNALQVCPAISDMKTLIANSSLMSGLNAINNDLYGLIAWLMTTNSAHVRPLTEKEKIKSLKNVNQFVLLCSTPEKEAKFQEIKKKEGGKSIWAFHGSSMTNWFTIMRTGLKNLSNTKHMTSGAAHGEGIYMATNSFTSLGYCTKFGRGGGFPNSFGKNPLCMALCEIVPPKKLYRSGDFIVLKEEDRVVTRFLLVGDNIPNVNSEKIVDEIPHIV